MTNTIFKKCHECKGFILDKKKYKGHANCQYCKGTGEIPVTISAEEIYLNIAKHKKICTIERCGIYCEIDRQFISLEDFDLWKEELIEEIKKEEFLLNQIAQNLNQVMNDSEGTANIEPEATITLEKALLLSKIKQLIEEKGR